MFLLFTYQKQELDSAALWFVFTVENARLPQGEKGRGFLPEPGWPDAVLQVSAPVSVPTQRWCLSKCLSYALDNNYTQNF